jgi:hypothetical protein
MRVGILTGVVLAVLGLATAGPALAAPGTGVHVDPGSPAGKQYAIPIPSARSEAAGQTGGSGSGSSNPPLFGVGVTPGGVAAGAAASVGGSATGAGTGKGTPRTRAAGRSRSGSTGAGSASHSAGSETGRQIAARRTAESNSVGGTSWLPLLGGGALVLLVGGGGGFFLRRSL